MKVRTRVYMNEVTNERRYELSRVPLPRAWERRIDLYRRRGPSSTPSSCPTLPCNAPFTFESCLEAPFAPNPALPARLVLRVLAQLVATTFVVARSSLWTKKTTESYERKYQKVYTSLQKKSSVWAICMPRRFLEFIYRPSRVEIVKRNRSWMTAVAYYYEIT